MRCRGIVDIPVEGGLLDIGESDESRVNEGGHELTFEVFDIG